MFTQGRLVENVRIIPVAVPIDTTGAAVASDWVNLKYARRLAVVIMKGAWAGGTPAVTLKQATSATGTGTKALSFTKQYSGTALTDDILAENTVSSDTFNLSATANEFHVIEVHASDLDLANGFSYVQLAIASPGSNADLIAALFLLYECPYAGKIDTLPSSIT